MVEEKASVAIDSLSDAEAMEIFSKFGFAAESAERLYGGYASSNFKVVGRRLTEDSAEPQAFLLKINYYGLSVEDAEHQLFVMDHLRGTRFPTNYPNAAPDGKMLVEHGGRKAMLLDFVGGAVPGDKVLGSDASKMPKVLKDLAGALAALHAVAWPSERPLRDIKQGYPVCNTGDLLKGEELNMMEADPRFAQHPFIAFVRESLPTFCALYERDDVPWGLIHGDGFLDNTLFRDGPAGSGECELLALIDWEDSCVGPFVLDVAVCASACCFTGTNELIVERLQEILRAYEAVRPLSEVERGSFVDFMMAGALSCGFYRFGEFHVRQPDSDAKAKSSYEVMFDRAQKLRQGEIRDAITAALGLKA